MSTSRSPAAGLELGITLLTLATAVIHLYVGFAFGNTLFVLNGLGYLGLLALLQLPVPQLAPLRPAVRWVLLGYTVLTIVLYFIMAPFFALIGIVDKVIEVALVVLLVLSARRPEPAGGVSGRGTAPA